MDLDNLDAVLGVLGNVIAGNDPELTEQMLSAMETIEECNWNLIHQMVDQQMLGNIFNFVAVRRDQNEENQLKNLFARFVASRTWGFADSAVNRIPLPEECRFAKLPTEITLMIFDLLVPDMNSITVSSDTTNVGAQEAIQMMKVCADWKVLFGSVFYRNTTFIFPRATSLQKSMSHNKFTLEKIRHIELPCELISRTRFIELARISGLQTLTIIIELRWETFHEAINPTVRLNRVSQKISQALGGLSRSNGFRRLDLSDGLTLSVVKQVTIFATVRYLGSLSTNDTGPLGQRQVRRIQATYLVITLFSNPPSFILEDHGHQLV